LIRRDALPPPADPVAAGARVRLRTLVLVRWIAIAGQLVTVLVVAFGIGVALPLNPLLGAIAASAALNLALALWGPAARIGERGTAFLLAWDVLQLSILLYFTGGLANPFALLLLAPVTISATILSRVSTVALCALSIVATTVIAVHARPLDLPGPDLELPSLLLAGTWTALTLGSIFLAAYAGSVAAESRRMLGALAAMQAALAREQRLSAVGALAAATAHELGTPLGTIAVVAREIARELPPDDPLADDARLLIQEAARCRDILAELATKPGDDEAGPLARPPLAAIVETAAAPHARPGIALRPRARRGRAADDAPAGARARARQPAAERAAVRAPRGGGADRRGSRGVDLTIEDDGPGFPPAILDRLGEPYLSGRSERGESMGLGVFIAVNLLQRTGAMLSFANRPEGGARVVVRWPRAALGAAR
jgi:two-component system sensor histidine kinase RegB